MFERFEGEWYSVSVLVLARGGSIFPGPVHYAEEELGITNWVTRVEVGINDVVNESVWQDELNCLKRMRCELCIHIFPIKNIPMLGPVVVHSICIIMVNDIMGSASLLSPPT